MAKVTLKNLSHSYLSKQNNDLDWALRGINIDWKDGGAYALLGPSGCGKTTLLRAIAGFIPLVAGTIRIKGETVSSSQQHIDVTQRKVGVVFQDFALFPHLTVGQNIVFGLHKQTTQQQQKREKNVIKY